MNSKLFIVCFFLFSCKSNPTHRVDKWELDTNTRPINVTTSSYNKAVQTAQSTMPTFIKLLNDRKNNMWRYFIKSRFAEGKEIEHMWVEADTASAEYVYGRLDNDPIKLTNIKFNDKVHVRIKDIEDYTIYEGDSILLGNFISHSLEQ
jgi:uncharacterized protein YegJ (DUF2314 family)